MVQQAGSPPSSTIMQVPPWAWNNDPAKLLTKAGFHAQPIDGVSSGRWLVRTVEDYLRIHPDLVKVDHLAGPALRQPRFELLDSFVVAKEANKKSKRIEAALRSRADRAAQTGEPVDYFSLWQLHTITVPGNDLLATVKDIHSELLKIRVQGEQAELVFNHAGVHVIRRMETLIHRVKIVSVLLRVEYDDKLRAGDTAHVRKANESGDMIFSASEKLYDGIYLFDAYLAPLLGALTPGIWAIGAHREFGTIIHSLGRPLAGTTGDAAELLQLLPVQADAEAVEFSTLSESACSMAIEWYATRLNELFGVLSNPAVFSVRSGEYSPPKHLHALLTVEQLFRRVSSIQSTHRDVNARRVLFFSVLDTLERLTGRSIEVHCDPDFAEKVLANLEQNIPPLAAEVLLPAGRRGVAALKRLQDGFYLQRYTGNVEVDVRGPSGVISKMDMKKAVAEYVKMLRNATHGHGTNKPGRIELTNSLLAQHDGDVPHDLGLLGYLYLIDFLMRPDVIERVFYNGGK